MKTEVKEKEEIQVAGVAETFPAGTCQKGIPQFWQRHSMENHGIFGVFGICRIQNGSVTYMIADPDHGQEKELQRAVIPAGKWIVFSDHGPLPYAIQKTEEQIRKWESDHPEMETDPSIMVEFYSDPCDYEKGGQDERYSYEVWIRAKQEG